MAETPSEQDPQEPTRQKEQAVPPEFTYSRFEPPTPEVLERDGRLPKVEGWCYEIKT